MNSTVGLPQTQTLPQIRWAQLHLAQQLVPLRRPLDAQSRSPRSLTASAAVCGVASAAVPLPGLAVHPLQSRRATASSTGNGIRNSPADLLPRTLSGKLAGTSEGVTQVHSPEELQDQLRKNDGKLVVLMCKAMACRPCKMFSRKYHRIAAEHSANGAAFLEMMGDETLETRKLMISMQIKVTPTFCFYRGMEVVRTVTGINEDNLRSAVREELQEDSSQQQQLAPSK